MQWKFLAASVLPEDDPVGSKHVASILILILILSSVLIV
jgi:hypothetical protein